MLKPLYSKKAKADPQRFRRTCDFADFETDLQVYALGRNRSVSVLPNPPRSEVSYYAKKYEKPHFVKLQPLMKAKYWSVLRNVRE